MHRKAVVLALVTGVTAFVAVGVATTELAAPWIEFSLFVGIPAGVLAGAVAATGVYLGLADDAPPQRRRVALAVAGFGVAFFVVLMAGAVVFDLGVVTALGLGAVLGVAAAVVSYWRTAPPPRAVR